MYEWIIEEEGEAVPALEQEEAFGVQGREWQEHRNDGGWRKLENETKVSIALSNSLQGEVAGLAFQKRLGEKLERGEEQVPSCRQREHSVFGGPRKQFGLGFP